MKKFKEIKANKQEILKAEEDGYTHLLMVDNHLYALSVDELFDCYSKIANEVVKLHGYDLHSHDDERFMGSTISDYEIFI
jgi:hypothetical protein